MINLYGERALLWFSPKRVYIHADAAWWDKDGRQWRAHNNEAPQFDGLVIDGYRKPFFWSANIIASSEEFLGRVRYYNQIRTCPICGTSDVTYGGSSAMFSEHAEKAFNEASFLHPHIFSPCSANSSRCYSHSDYDARTSLLGSVLASYPKEDNEDRTVEPAQICTRLGISSHDDEAWFGAIRERAESRKLPATRVVDHLLSTVWSPRSKTRSPLAGIPKPEEISPEHYPLPADSGVYFLYSGDKVVYVGQSGTANSRIKEHRRTGKSFDSVAFVRVEDPRARLSVERHYIGAFNPELNKA